MSDDEGLPCQPAMGDLAPPTWPHARWIGWLSAERLPQLPASIPLAGADGFATARFLIRDGLDMYGFVETPIVDGAVSRADIEDQAQHLAKPVAGPQLDDLPPITVATSTRNRPHNIKPLVESLLALDYPDFEIIIVDNASDGPETLEAVAAFNHPRVRGVREPLPGTSRGRNTALLEAKHRIVAFLDDDVVADKLWLRGIAQGFARASDVGVVTGMVPTGELSTAAQGYFESRIAWEVACRAKVFSLATPPPNMPMFPFEVGDFGTGANFAVDRDLVVGLGGLNKALGGGAPSTAGEDIELFVRVLYAGARLVYEPSAVAWHRHRRGLDELRLQIRNYGRGFGAWITTVFLDPQMRADAVRLVLKGLRRTQGMASLDAGVKVELGLDTAELRSLERRALMSVPYWYVRSRLDRRVARPLKPR